MIMHNFIFIDFNNDLRHLASNEGATYDFPMIIGNENTVDIYTLSYVESQGNFKKFFNIYLFLS